ncbi:complexin-1 [Alligator mississippiensis]|nr:complexin-1 [Alligator mississippiensis]
MDFVMKQALGGATKDMGKMLGGDEEKDPDAAKKEEERQEALRQEEEERKAKYAKMEAEREVMRQGIRDKYGIKKKEEREAEAQAALEANAEGSLTRPKKAIPPGCGDEEEEEEESILDTVIKYLPGPLQDMFKKLYAEGVILSKNEVFIGSLLDTIGWDICLPDDVDWATLMLQKNQEDLWIKNVCALGLWRTPKHT